MPVSTPVLKDSPLNIAWESYRATEDFANSKHWALEIAPMIQGGSRDAKRQRYSLMPIVQRERHVEGSLWAAFMAGFNAASVIDKS